MFLGKMDVSSPHRSFLVLCLLKHQFHGFVVIVPDLGIRDPAIPLGRRDMFMAQKILDAREIRVGIEELGREGVPEPMARCGKPCLVAIVLDSLLDAPDRYPRPGEGSFLDEKERLCLGRSLCHVGLKGDAGIIAQVDDPILCPFSVRDEDLPFPVLYRIAREVGNLFDAKARAEHEGEYGPVPEIGDHREEPFHLVVFQVPGKGFREAYPDAPDRVLHRDHLLFDEIVEEEVDGVKMADDGCRRSPCLPEMVDVRPYASTGDVLEEEHAPRR